MAWTEKDQEKHNAMTLNNFPPEILGPWQERVREELPDWEAHCLATLGAPQDDDWPVWTLRRQNPYVALHDTSQSRLLYLAEQIDLLLSE